MRGPDTTTPVTARQGDVLYFDGQCPICRTEVNRLRRLAAPSLSYRDINQAGEIPLDKETLFSELHLQRADGSWATGLDANIIAWQHTRLRPLATLLTLPVVNSIARVGYRLWLTWYQRQRKQRQQRLRPTPGPAPNGRHRAGNIPAPPVRSPRG